MTINDGEQKTPSSNFETLPERLKEILLDLEKNHEIIQKINSGIIFKKEFFKKIENSLYSNYEPKESQFLKTIFKLLKEKEWIDYRILENNFNYLVHEEIPETITSTGKEKSLPLKKSGNNGDSPLSSSQNGDWRRDVFDTENVESDPLFDRAHEIENLLKEMELYIDPELNVHARLLKYRFGFDLQERNKPEEQVQKEQEIYSRIITHLEPDFKDNRWAWPILYTNKKLKMRAHFSIRMNEHGSFLLSLKRGHNLQEFFYEFEHVFHFLSPEEITFIFECLQFTHEKSDYHFVHVAAKLTPKEKAQHLNKTKLTFRWVNHQGIRKLTIIIDRSKGYLELEAKGNYQDCMDWFEFATNAGKASLSVKRIGDEVSEVKKEINDLKQGQSIIHQRNGHSLVVIQTLQEKISRIRTQMDELIIQNDLNNGDLQHLFRNTVNGFKEGIIQVFSNIMNELSKDVNEIKESLENTIWNNAEKIVHEQQVVSNEMKKVSKGIQVLNTNINFENFN